MVLSFDEVGERLDAMAEQFPPAFFDELNGGVSLLPDTVPDPRSAEKDLYILGEYCRDQMGRYINLYYGSFVVLAKAEKWDEADWEEELHTTLAHELTHHVEGRAGERGLEIKDANFLAEYWAEQAANEDA